MPDAKNGTKAAEGLDKQLADLSLSESATKRGGVSSLAEYSAAIADLTTRQLTAWLEEEGDELDVAKMPSAFKSKPIAQLAASRVPQTAIKAN